MNFLGILKGVAKVAGTVAQIAAPEIAVFNPALGALVGRISSSVVNAEAQIPEDGKGPEKHSAVVNNFNDQFSLAQQFLKLGNRQMTYDADLLDQAIKAEVTKMNIYAQLAKSIKVIDI